MVSPNENCVWISVPFAFKFEINFFEISFARMKVLSGKSLDEGQGFFGMIITCPLDIGFISKTAKAEEFSEIFF